MGVLLLQAFTEDDDSARAFRRFRLSLTVGISPSSGKAPARGVSTLAKATATVTNVSMSGLCFSSATEFPAGTQVLVDLVLDRRLYRLPAAVRRCTAGKYLGRTCYACGVQFLKSNEALQFLPLMAKYLLAQDDAAEE